MTLDAIQKQLEKARNAPIEPDGSSAMWDLLPRVLYSELPESLRIEADKITTDKARSFLLECYPEGSLKAYTEQPEIFEKSIREALRLSKYLIEPNAGDQTTGASVSLVAVDIMEAWEKVTHTGSKRFSTIRQGCATNTLTKLRAIDGKTARIDRITGTATIKKGNFSLTIPNYENLAGLKTSTWQLLDAITIALTETGAKGPTVVVPLSDYMERRGIKNRQEAKNQAREDLEVLRQASITGVEKRGKNTNTYSFVNLADSGEIRKNGDIIFTFGSTFYSMLLGYPVMPYPDQLQMLSSRKNPNGYYLLRRITEHKNMNAGKKNEDTISVKTLLSAAPYIPTYKEIMEDARQVSKRIIEPFERDMDALSDTLKWNYCHSNRQPLTDAELQYLDYATFSKLCVNVSWVNYPDQTDRLLKKEERKDTAKKKKPAKK